MALHVAWRSQQSERCCVVVGGGERGRRKRQVRVAAGRRGKCAAGFRVPRARRKPLVTGLMGGRGGTTGPPGQRPRAGRPAVRARGGGGIIDRPA
ncbi:hypothetical protein MTO96_011991 [Rhipicephalus appendiculatus]